MTKRIPDEELTRIKAENPAEAVAAKYGVEVHPRSKMARCPHHEEKTPSFHVTKKGFYCFGCGWSGDVIDFIQAIENVDFAEACRRLGAKEDPTPITDDERQKRRQEARERRRAQEAEEEAERRQKRATWPKMYLGNHRMLQGLADLRGLSFTAVKLAWLAGTIKFCRWKGHVCWAVCNSALTCAQVRRVDGGMLAIGEIEAKSQDLPGSKKVPVGLTRHPLPVILTEGGPDYLAAWELIHRQHQEASFQPACMLGTSAKLNGYAEWLRDREVLILADADRAGRKAAESWREEAEAGGASSVVIGDLPEGTDLNDFIKA